MKVDFSSTAQPLRRLRRHLCDGNDPVTGEVATRAAAASEADATSASKRRRAAFPTWSKTGPGERRALLIKAADVHGSARRTNSLRPMIEETGATAPWAGFNVMLRRRHAARGRGAMTTQITGEVIPSDKPGVTSPCGIRQPAGVVLGIAPWNAPVILGVRAIAMPLACGNTVVLKASESLPGDPRLIGQMPARPACPRASSTSSPTRPRTPPKVVEALIAHPAVRRVNFTGSTRVGKMHRASWRPSI